MFEATLSAKFRKMFEVKKVVFDMPGESLEQDVLFVEVTLNKNSIRDGRAFAKVTGKVHMNAEAEKLPFGYFAKNIQLNADDAKDLFFYDFEENTRLYENIVQRSVSFVYFFNVQYDPAVGTITSITTEVSS